MRPRNSGILRDAHTAIGAIGRGQQAPAGAGVDAPLLVARRATGGRGHDPYLQQVRRPVRLRVEFAVPHAGAGAHALNLAGTDHGAVAEAVPVFQRAIENDGDDLHVAMAVGREAFARRDDVLVDHAQRAPAISAGS